MVSTLAVSPRFVTAQHVPRGVCWGRGVCWQRLTRIADRASPRAGQEPPRTAVCADHSPSRARMHSARTSRAGGTPSASNSRCVQTFNARRRAGRNARHGAPENSQRGLPVALLGAVERARVPPRTLPWVCTGCGRFFPGAVLWSGRHPARAGGACRLLERWQCLHSAGAFGPSLRAAGWGLRAALQSCRGGAPWTRSRLPATSFCSTDRATVFREPSCWGEVKPGRRVT